MRTRRARKRGFTLVEVMVALVIVAIGLVALVRVQVITIRMTERAARLSRAVRLAETKLAETLAAEKREIGAREGTDDEQSPAMRWRVLTRATKAAALTDAGVEGMREVTVVVTWPDGEREQVVQLGALAREKVGE